MKFKKYLKEEFAGSRKLKIAGRAGTKLDIEFFKNPTPKEMQIAQKASKQRKCVRFYADFKKKEVLVWEGRVLHEVVIQALKSKNIYITPVKLFIGSGTYQNGKINILENYYLDTQDDCDYINWMLSSMIKHKTWLLKYFSNVNEYIDKWCIENNGMSCGCDKLAVCKKIKGN